MTEAQRAAASRRRDVKAPAGLTGRFVYEPAADPGSPGYTVYTVTRASDGRYLGDVRRRHGGTFWEWTEPLSAFWHDRTGPDGAKPTRRGWAADQLDAVSLLYAWCACGVAVGVHDRPTRAACRAWARWVDDAPGTRRDAAWQNAWAARPRGKHYDVGPCADHAAQYVKGLTPGQVWLVEPDVVPAQNAWVRHDDRLGCVAVTRIVGGRFGDTTAYPADYTLETVVDLVIAQGLATAYDWRR